MGKQRMAIIAKSLCPLTINNLVDVQLFYGLLLTVLVCSDATGALETVSDQVKILG